MVERTLVKELKHSVGGMIKVQGWVQRIRKLGKIAFILLRERSGVVQCVIDTTKIELTSLKVESVITIVGRVVEANVALGVELQVQSLEIISEVGEDLPFELNKEELEVNMEMLLDHRVLGLRHEKTNAIFKVQAVLAQAFGAFLKEEGFTQIYTSKIVAEGTEGGTELFEIEYFDRKAYLAQSPQFYKQMMVGAGYERVFEIGHVYRAESHATSRHINEYVSLDLEMGFITDEMEIMDLETRMLRYMLTMVKAECPQELEVLGVRLPEIREKIPALKMSEVIEILHRRYDRTDLEMDLDPEAERMIGEYAVEKYGSEFVFITHYPQSKRPLYTMPAEEGMTHSFDLLFRGLEITTGGQRIHSYQQLCQSIRTRGMDPENYADYLEVFKFGMPPHGGLAIGLERLTGQLLGYKNIRQVTLFPRDKNRVQP